MDELVKALGPAFAAGFAVQRLLEILDPVVNRLVGETTKKTALGLISLAFGFAAAFVANLRVLGPLMNIKSEGAFGALDLVVSGLVISAGTEGFNSVMKFLSYKKEEKKAQAVSEKVNALEAADLGAAGSAPQIGVSRRLESFAIGTLGALPERILKPGVSVEKGLELALKDEILARWRDKFIEDGWLGTAFGDYTDDADDPPVVVLTATERIAGELNIRLRDDLKRDLQSRSKLDTTPEDILPRMEHVLEWPA